MANPGKGSKLTRATHPSGPVPGNESIEVAVYVRPRPGGGSAGLDSLFDGPPIERRYLTPDQIIETFGADPADLDEVANFADKSGFKAGSPDIAQRLITLSGTASDFENAFGVKLLLYDEFGGQYRGYEGDLTLPSALEPLVTAIFGLENRPVVFAEHGPQPKPPPDVQPATLQDLADLYVFPAHKVSTGEKAHEAHKPDEVQEPLTGDGITVGILRLGGSFDMTEIGDYFTGLGLSTPNVTTVGTDQAPLDQTAELETSIDIEVIGNLAPGAKIVIYYAGSLDTLGLVQLVKSAVGDTVNNPAVLSISWGAPELMWKTGQPKELDLTLKQAGASGITVCSASGDFGSSGIAPSQGAADGLAHVVLPAACPHALGCGGTILEHEGKNITSEVAWNDDTGATGGGVSTHFGVPTWQKKAKVPDSVNPSGGAGRGVPDVAAHAGLTSYVVAGLLNPEQHIGGTSVSAPLWAALIALIDEGAGTRMGFLNAYLYKRYAKGPAGKAAFRDVSKGDNKQTLDVGGGNFVTPPSYSAAKGWDACTGLGSPNGAKLYELLLQK